MERVDRHAKASSLLRKQRIKRIVSEIHLLEQMDWRLWKLGLMCFWAMFVGVIVGTFGVAIVLVQPAEVSYLAVFLSILVGVSVLYWMWRYPIWLAALLCCLVFALFIAAIFEDVPDSVLLDPGLPPDGSNSTDKKEILRRRVQHAIEKRQKLLQKLKV